MVSVRCDKTVIGSVRQIQKAGVSLNLQRIITMKASINLRKVRGTEHLKAYDAAIRIFNEIVNLAVKGRDYTLSEDIDWGVRNHFSFDGAKERVVSASRIACGLKFGRDTAEREILTLEVNAYAEGKKKITSLEFRVGVFDGECLGMGESYASPPS